MSDLWRSVQSGDVAAFNTLYDKHWEAIYHTIYWRVCDEDIAKDILQEVFIALWEKRAAIQIKDTVEGYLRTMAKNKIISFFRADSVRKGHTRSAGNHLPTASDTTSELLAGKEVRKHYEEAVSRLPDKMREIYLLNREQGNTIEQVSVQLSLSPQTVKNQLTAATKKIRLALAPLLTDSNASVRRLSLSLFFSL